MRRTAPVPTRGARDGRQSNLARKKSRHKSAAPLLEL